MNKRIFELGDTGVRVYVELDNFGVNLRFAHDNSASLVYDSEDDKPLIEALYSNPLPVVEPAKEVTE